MTNFEETAANDCGNGFLDRSFPTEGRDAAMSTRPSTVELALQHCFEGGVEPFLDRSGLREALGHILPRRPSYRTLERWAHRGLPYGRDPLNGRRIYLLSAVVTWFYGAMSIGSPAAEGRSAARQVRFVQGSPSPSIPRAKGR